MYDELSMLTYLVYSVVGIFSTRVRTGARCRIHNLLLGELSVISLQGIFAQSASIKTHIYTQYTEKYGHPVCFGLSRVSSPPKLFLDFWLNTCSEVVSLARVRLLQHYDWWILFAHLVKSMPRRPRNRSQVYADNIVPFSGIDHFRARDNSSCIDIYQ